MATKARQRVRRAPLVKATTIGRSAPKSNKLMELLTASNGALPGGALDPPFDFAALYRRYEESSLLRPNVDAYVTNIESFGHHFNPSVDLAATEASTQLANAMYYERALDAHEQGQAPEQVPEPTEQEVADYTEKVKRSARLEYSRLDTFFSFACPELSFTELRRRTRQDLEVIGNAFWEIIRNDLGEIAHIYYVNPLNMRLCPKEDEPVLVDTPVRITRVAWRTKKVPRFFRRFVKLGGKKSLVHFKEFGDKRVASRDTGVVYQSKEEMLVEEPEALPATEILHFAVYTPTSPYGIPRWISNLPGVLGTRELEEVNYNYFENNVVPPLALLVSGGRLGKGVASKIEEYIDEHLKGKSSSHRILVLEAESQRTAGDLSGPRQAPRVMFVPLRDAQQSDALFQAYDLRNEEKIARCFRLPRILRGDDKQTNRATAYAALKFAEEQVFEPEREAFDAVINRQFFPDMGITFWIFRSNSPIVRDPEALAEMADRLVRNGTLTIAEAREIAADVFNKVFREVSEEWTHKPMPFVLAQLQGGQAPTSYGMGTSFAPLPDSNRRARESEPVPEPEAQAPVAPAPLRRAGTPLGTAGVGDDEV